MDKKEKQDQKDLEKNLTKKEKKLLHQVLRDRAKRYGKRLKGQTRKSLNTALIAAFGFIIALAWRDVIMEYVGLITSLSPVQGMLIHALIVTFIAVIGIILVTKFLPAE